jgi:hypothetical protein
MGEKRHAYRVLIGKRSGKTPLRRPDCSWKDNATADLKGTGREDVDWIDVVHDWNRWRTGVKTVMNLRVPKSAGNFSTS